MAHLRLVPDLEPLALVEPATVSAGELPAGDRDYGYEAQQAAEAHLALCWEAFYSQEDDGEGDDGDEPSESPAIGPFCGCETCVTREILYAAWPLMEASVRAEVANEQAEAGTPPSPTTPSPLL